MPNSHAIEIASAAQPPSGSTPKVAWRRLARTLVLGGSCALAACVDTPSTTPSESELQPESLGLTTAVTPQISDTWWTEFKDPQLDALIDQALASSPTLAVAIARMHEAQAQLSETRAQTYPQIHFDGEDQRTRFSKNYIIPPPFAGTTQWFGQIQANLSWSLDLFGKQAAEVEQAGATAEAAELDTTAARLALSAAVAQAYVALDRAHRVVDVARDTVGERQRVFDLTHGRVNAGLDTKSSEDQALALLALAKQDLALAQGEREITVHAIAALIGRGADAYAIARPRLHEAALSMPAKLPIDLLARRADIAAAKARVNAATSGREAAEKAFYPDIDLVGAAGFAAIGLTTLFSASSRQYGLGAAIHLPIFDAGELNARFAGATADLDEAVASYNESVVMAVNQTSDALTRIASVRAQNEQQGVALHAAQSSFDLAKQRYRSGLSPQLNVLNAEETLLQARRQQATLTDDLLSARISLVTALGGGFAADRVVADTSAGSSGEQQ